MPRTLFVVLGAGASYDAADLGTVDGNVRLPLAWNGQVPNIEVPRDSLRPPLVTGLFEHRFAEILKRYPLAQMGASEITSHLGSSVALEEFLRNQYRDSPHASDKRIFHAIHFYLQDLLWTISRSYTTHPQNYDRLILQTAGRLPHVVFISLNYDTILDDRLRDLSPGTLTDLGSYCDPSRNWSLIKPHGSVDWSMTIGRSAEWNQNGHTLVRNPPPEIATQADNISVRRSDTLEGIRYTHDSIGPQWYYPAISAPLGPRDTFTCPDLHIDYLREQLAQQERLDILMLGYSGLDDEVIKLFRDAGRPLGRVHAVSKNKAEAKAAMGRLVNGVTSGVWNPLQVTASAENFSRFVTGPGLSSYLASLKVDW